MDCGRGPLVPPERGGTSEGFAAASGDLLGSVSKEDRDKCVCCLGCSGEIENGEW